MLLNVTVIIIIVMACVIALTTYIKKGDLLIQEEELELYGIPHLVQGVKKSFETILNKNPADLNLNKTETLKREKMKSLIRINLRSCGHGDINAKEFIKDYIKEILQKNLGVNENTINKTLPFDKEKELTLQDKFEILLYLYKKQYNFDALSQLIKTYHLDEMKLVEEGERYEITSPEFNGIYEMESPRLKYLDKLEILTQRVYQLYKGFGVIDEIRDMKIDGVSGGISGIPYDLYMHQKTNSTLMDFKDYNAFQSVWIFFEGKTIHLSFLGFESQKELIRVCKNIYRFGNPGQLSEAKGYIANDMKDGSRVVVFRPPFSDRWAFFVRKHDSIKDIDIHKIITDDGNDTLIDVLKWMVKGCLVLVITGEMGSGKTTLLKLLIQYIKNTYTIRVHEQIFELNLSLVYQDLNILTLKETETISGQDALDIMKKTDGTVIILGEVASHTAANWLVETAQISKMTMCSHHAKTTDDLIDNLKISQLRAGGFHNEYLAEQQVVKAINIDIHMENRNGHRYISKITEIIPVSEQDYPPELTPATLEYFKRNTNRKSYKTVDILCFENGKYVLKNPLSQGSIEHIKKNLNEAQVKEFDSLFASINRKGAAYE